MGRWKNLVAAVVGFGASAGLADSRAGDRVSTVPVWKAKKPTEPPVVRSLAADGFPDPIFAPNTGPAVVPAGRPVAPQPQLPPALPPGWVVVPAGQLAVIPPGPTTPDVPPLLATLPELPATAAGPKPEPPKVDAAKAPLLVPPPRKPDESLCAPAALLPTWRTWGGAEFLLGTGRPVAVPAVVTTGPAAAGIGTAGSLGGPGTTPLFGGRKMLGDWRGGLRAEMGVWFDDHHTWGAMGRFYSLYSTSDQFVGTGNGANVVNLPQLVPFADTTVQFPIYVGFPGLTTGTVSTTAQTYFAGGDLSLRRSLVRTSRWQLDALFGYRQLYLHDELGAEFAAAGTVVPDPLTPVLSGGDSIRTYNHFFGAHLGIIGSVTRNRWTLEGQTAVALGVNASDLNFDRTRAAGIGPLGPVTLVDNEVRDRSSYFGTVWEGGVKAWYRVGENFRVSFGYTALAWWNVRRAQEQFTLGPVPRDENTHFLAHMISWGAELRY